VFTATGIRLSELPTSSTIPMTRAAATSTYGGERSPSAARCKDRIVKIGHQAALSLDRLLRARARHSQVRRTSCGSGPAIASR
jgi:hypothetical protein